MMKFLSAACAAALAATSANATTEVTFSFLKGSTVWSSGSFSYDDSKSGLLNFSDLTSFNYHFSNGDTYDLSYLESGNFSVFYYFGYDATNQKFVATNIYGYVTYMSAVKDTYGSGFTTLGLGDGLTVGDYAPAGGNFPLVRLVLSSSNDLPPVPEPATWAMFIGGFGLIGGAMRNRRTRISFA